MCRRGHPNIYVFIEILQKEQTTKEAKIIKINAGGVRENIGSWIGVYSVSRTACVEVKWML